MLMSLGFESSNFFLLEQNRSVSCDLLLQNMGHQTHLAHNPVIFWGEEHPDSEVKLISQRGVIVVGITQGRRLQQLQYLLRFEYEEENAFKRHNSKLKQQM